MNDENEAGRRVAAGIRLLDERAPGDWRDHVREVIASDEFDMASTVYCVLGSIYGDCVLGCNELGIDPGYDMETHGFDSEYGGADYDDLDEAWKAALA